MGVCGTHSSTFEFRRKKRRNGLFRRNDISVVFAEIRSTEMIFPQTLQLPLSTPGFHQSIKNQSVNRTTLHILWLVSKVLFSWYGISYYQAFQYVRGPMLL
jgi:hypothetical protein